MRILLIVILFLGINLNAQKQPYGIKVGSNLSHLVGDGTQDASFSSRLHAGLYMEILIDDLGSFQPELLYTGYGFKLDNNGLKTDVGLNYLALSVLSKIFIFKRFSLDAGPQVGLLVSANDREDNVSNLKSDFYNRDFGVNLGCSYDILKKITASFRYYVGLTDVTTVDSKNFNRSFQIAFQYKIN